MPVQREARYLSPNDIGKMVTYEAPIRPNDQASKKVLLGGVLENLSTEVRKISEPRLMEVQTDDHYYLIKVKAELSGHEVPLLPNQVVTIYGMDGN